MKLWPLFIVLKFITTIPLCSQPNPVRYDSVVVYDNAGNPIRYSIPIEPYIVGSATDSLLAISASTKKKTLIAQSTLTANQTITLSGDISGSGTTAITTSIGSGKVTNTMLAGSIDLSTKVTGILPFSSNAGSSTATSGTTGTISVPMTSRIITCTPTGSITFNGTNGVVGQMVTFVITTSGTTIFTITFGTSYKTTSTLSTGTTSGKVFLLTFLCTAATPTWSEMARTTAM